MIYTFCLNNKENASGNKTRVWRSRRTLNKSELITIKRELGKDVDDHKTSNTESLPQILFTFKRLFINITTAFKSQRIAHTKPRHGRKNFCVSRCIDFLNPALKIITSYTIPSVYKGRNRIIACVLCGRRI